MIFLQILPTIENNEDVGFKSFLFFVIALLISAIVYIYKTKDKRIQEVVDEHKEDLKQFDLERSKTVNEQIQALHKIALSMERNSDNTNDIVKNLNKVISLAESIKNKVNE